MRSVPVAYVPGGSWGICQVCGFKERLNDMMLRWDGLRVCAEDWDPRPDTMSPPDVYPEGLPRPDAAPQPPDVFVGTVRPSDL